MNRFVIAALAATALFAPVAQAQDASPERRGEPRAEDRQEGRGPAHGEARHGAQAQPRKAAVPQRQYHAEVKQPHGWRAGERFDRRYAPHYTRVVHVDHYGLKPPQPGYVWVRSGADAVLVRLSNNIVVAIHSGVF